MNQHTGDATSAGQERTSFMRDALDSYDTDWLWFLGADTLITNMTIDIRDLCDDEFDFIIAEDINGINNDSFLLKASNASRRFLRRVAGRRDVPHDQAAMSEEMHECGMRTKLVGQRLFNSFKYDEYNYGPYPEGDWQDGDFVLHMPGMSNQRRFELMLEFSDKIRR
jgi:hypothetical protein